MGYRYIKVNVLYRSTLNPDLKMICEVQFTLNQCVNLKKRIHKLDSITREQAYFDWVVMDEDKLERHQRKISAMKFEAILTVGSNIDLGIENDNGQVNHSCIDSDFKLLGLTGESDYKVDKFVCIDLETKKSIFQHPAHGQYSHHWITINDQKYLSLQTTKYTLSMFRVSDDHQFVEDESMKITVDGDGDKEGIQFLTYDQSFEHLFIIRNLSIYDEKAEWHSQWKTSSFLEKRAVADLGTVIISIKLENACHQGRVNQNLMSLTDDGKFCAYAGAFKDDGTYDFNQFNIISLETQEQVTVKSNHWILSTCFINGQSEFVAAGGGEHGEGVEIWSVARKEKVHHIGDERNIPWRNPSRVTGMSSWNGILAVGFDNESSRENFLVLYDVLTWSKIYRLECKTTPYSLRLTADRKHLIAGGNYGCSKTLPIIRIQ